MMKLIFLAFMIFLNDKMFILGTVMLMLYIMITFPQSSFILSPELDFLSGSLVILTAWLLVLMVKASVNSKKARSLVLLLKFYEFFWF